MSNVSTDPLKNKTENNENKNITVEAPTAESNSASSSNKSQEISNSQSSSESNESKSDESAPSNSNEDDNTGEKKEEDAESSDKESSTQETTSSSSEENEFINLKLGDVIKIKDPLNEILNNNTFIIDYIDNRIIKMIDTNNFNLINIKINEDGTLGEGTIKSISLIYRNDKRGYARQNDLLPGVWVNIYFGGDIPTIVTGEITNLEQDMIEIKTFPEKELLYINFAYKGIPLNLPIEKFEIREKPSSDRSDIKTSEPQEEKETKPSSQEEDVIDQESIDISNQMSMPSGEEVKENIRDFILEANEIQFGDELKAIQQFVNVDESEKRFNIDLQMNDLLNELLSDIPNDKRTNMVLNNIHTILSRFKQLREEFSTFDEHGNVNGAIIKDALWKPLIQNLMNFKKSLYWVLPVAKNIKKINRNDTDPDNDDENDNKDYKYDGQRYYLKLKNIIETNNSNYTSLYRDINSFFTPFYDIDSEMKRDIIIEKEVADNFNVVIDNLGDFYSSAVFDKWIDNTRFLMDKYNTGLTRLEGTPISRNKQKYRVVNMTESDFISLKSLLTLPEPVIRFSHISLPGTNIYTKANLNTLFVYYWLFLNKKTSVNNVIVDINTSEEKNDVASDEKTFFNSINHFSLNKPEEPGDLSSNEMYNQFLEKVIPKTRTLFNMIKKYINGKLSLKNVVDVLEPFLIYTSDLTFMQYKDINIFLQEKISDYNKKFIEKSKYFSNIKRISSSNSNKPNDTSLKMMINESKNKQEVINIYNNSPFIAGDVNENNQTNSEFLTKSVIRDFGNIYNYCVAIENVFLMLPANINKLIEDKEANIENELIDLNKQQGEQCQSIVIAKQYPNLEELESDNDKTIYFDSKYDNTIYSIMDDFLNDQMRMLPADFHQFLIKKLKEKIKIDDKNAIYLAETLINGAKRVRSGHYAFYFDNNDNKIKYYVRDNNQWVLDTKIDEKTIGNKEDILCNFQDKCITVQDKYNLKCESMDVNKADMTKKAYIEIMNEFDKSYQMSKEELELRMKIKYDYNVKIIDKLNQIKENIAFKYNNQQYKIGVKQISADDSVVDIVVSPYTKILNIILGQSDFVKKQNDIISFTTRFTRAANTAGGENEYWLYCIKTNTQLLPTFIYTLASVFVQDPDNYSNTIEMIKKDIGGLSDDGDSWVDKKGGSGRVICKIDFDIDEGYEEGFKIKSRDVMEKEAGDIVSGNIDIIKEKTKSKYVNAETRLMVNVVAAFSEFMGVKLDDQLEFILKIANNALHLALPSETEYNKNMEEKSKKGKGQPRSYKTFYNFNILYLTMGAIIIAIQTSIPGVRSKRTFPGCARSFSGFPLEGNGDISSLKYMACIASKIPKSKHIDPWSGLGSSKEDKISEMIKYFIDTYFLKNIDVERKIKEKMEYLLIHPVEFIPAEHELNKWKNFLPPLARIHLKTIENISGHFKSDLLSHIKGTSPQQREKILIVQSKIIMFSLAIQEKIQKIVENKRLLLNDSSNQPFLENACCNEKGFETTLEYFIKEDGEIGVFNQNVQELSNILLDIKAISKASFLFCRMNDKNIYPGLSDKFNEETIYKAFIYFCKFKSLIPIPENLVSLCGEKPNLNVGDSILEQIRKLKSNGHNYTTEQFLRLLQVVNRSNLIKISLNDKLKTRITKMRDIIENISSNNNGDTKLVPLELRNHLDTIMDTYDFSLDEDTDQMRDFKNYLSNTNSKLKNELVNFIKNYGKLKNKEFNRLQINLNSLLEWRESDKEKNQTIYDETTYNSVHFVKDYIQNISKLFPNIIINQVKYSDSEFSIMEGLSRMDLSGYHRNEIIRNITDYYSDFNKFYEKSNLNNILQSVMANTNKFLMLVENTPYINEIKYKDFETHSVFDKRTTKLLFEFYFLTCVNAYIRYTDDDSMIIGDEDETTLTVYDNDENEVEPVSTLLIGDKKELKTKVAELLVIYFNIMFEHKSIINMNYNDIMDVVFKIKESEKDTFTDRLKAMNDESREVDTILKINKLGSWSKGLKKGLTQYDKDVFDEERETMDKLIQIEKNVRKNKNVVDGNFDQYMDDYMEDQQMGEDIENEEYNMGNMTEDYMDGYIDGDEDQDVGFDY